MKCRIDSILGLTTVQRVIDSFLTNQARRKLAAEIPQTNMIFALVCKIEGAYRSARSKIDIKLLIESFIVNLVYLFDQRVI